VAGQTIPTEPRTSGLSCPGTQGTARQRRQGVHAVEKWPGIRTAATHSTSLFHVGLVLVTGIVGYLLRLFGLPQLPMVLGVVLGFMVESNYRRSLVLSGGDHRVFLEDPIAVGLLICAALVVAFALRRELKPKRAEHD